MKTRKRRIYLLIIICCLGVVGGGVLLPGDGVVVGDEESQDDIRQQVGIWTPTTKIEQTFIASQNNLCRIDFAVDSYYAWDSPYLDCYLFEIRTDENPHELTYEFIRHNIREIRYTRINGWTISPHMFNSLSFTPIPDSQNKRYLLSFQSPETKKGGRSILLASVRDRYDYGNLFLDGKRKNEDLGFRFLYQRPRLKVLSESFARIALRKPFPFSKPGTYYVLIIGYILLIIVFVFQMFW